MKKIFFQSSLPRAGSTLLQNVMGQNPKFYVTPTSGVLELVYGARNHYTSCDEFKAQDKELMKKGFQNFCAQGINGYFDAITDRPYVLDKSRGWGYYYNFLDFIYPNPKIICMVRDLRDIFASMEKIFRKNPDMASGMENNTNLKGITTEERIDIWSSAPPVGLSLERLYQTLSEKNDKYIHFVKYEDFTQHPQREIEKIYNYLELPYFEHNFNNVKQITQENDSIHGIYGDHTIKSKITHIPSDAQEVLGKVAYNWIRNNYQWFYNYFGYD